MTAAIFAIILGLAGLALGGELLVRGAVGIARSLGISNLVTGLVIVGFATSMPEMVASVEAAMLGSPEIAWGNIAGSNIANSLLILGATAVVAPILLTGLGRRDAAVGLAASLLLWLIAFSQIGTPFLGVILFLLLGTYIWWRYNHPRIPETGADEEEEKPNLLLALVLGAGGIAALVAGGHSLISGAIDIATLAGISETVIGLTVVAIGTSLPELAASIAAAFRGKPGLAVGNVVGSNIYNILLIGGATMFIAPVPVPRELIGYELPFVAATAFMIWLILAQAQTIARWAGALLLLAFAANTVFLFS